MQKVFYDPVVGREIVDVSGKKSAEQIQQEFGGGPYQEISLAINESHRIQNGTLVKYDYAQENADRAEQKRQDREAKRTAFKAKMGWTDQDLDNLRDVLF